MYKGEMFSANLEKNRITIEVEGEMKVKAGKLVVLSDDEYTTLQAELEKAKGLIGKAKKELYDILTKSLEEAGANPREAEIIVTKSDIIYELTTFLSEGTK